MIAVEHMDYGALKLVRGEIDVNLLKAADALGSFRENTEDPAPIKSCASLLHQVHGALQVLDFTWASALAGVIERVARVIDEDHSRRTDWVYDTLARSINELPHYLAKLQEGEITPPMGFIPLLNDLRVAGGDSILSEAMVFSPENAVEIMAPSATEINATHALDIRALAGKLRPVYQTGLLVWYRDANNKAALRRLMEVMIQLQQASPDEGLWFSAGEVIGKLLEGELSYSTSIKLLLGQVERQIRRVMEAGPGDLFSNPPTDLIKNLLHYITVAESHTHPDSEAPSSQPVSSREIRVERAKSTLLDMATKAVKEELVWAKKKLDDFSRSGGRHTSGELCTIRDVLRRVSDTLDMLGRWELRQRVRKQAGVLESMLAGESILNDPRILEVANALLYVESLLGNKKIPAKPEVQMLQKNSQPHAQPMREEEYHELSRAIVREVMVDLTQVKDDIIAFSKETGQCELLDPVPGLMHRIIGALTMLSLRRPTIVLKAIYHYISHELLGVRVVPTQAALDTLADVLTSVEYFLETMVESQMNLDSLLDMAEGNITTLGYLVDRIDEMVVNVEMPVLAAAEPDIIVQDETIELSSVQDNALLGEGVAVVDASAKTESVAHAMQFDSPPVIVADLKKDTAVMKDQNEEVVEEIIEIFVEEATDAIATIQQYYPKWKKDNNDNEALKIFRRSFHTLKGSGRLVGANVVGELSWAVESLLNKIIEGEASVSPAVFDYLDECLGVIPGLVEKFQVNKTKVEISDDMQSLIKRSDKLATMPVMDIEPEQPVIADTEAPMVVAQQEALTMAPEMNDVIILDEIAGYEKIIGAVDVNIVDVPVIGGEISGIDPILLGIFTNESEGPLGEIREFINRCRKSKKCYVTEPLIRNLHTLQGSAHMSGFMRIAEISDIFERHINHVDQEKREISEDELSALSEYASIVDGFLHHNHPLHKSPDTLVTIERHRSLMAKMQAIVADGPLDNRYDEYVDEEIINDVSLSEHVNDDKEHDDMVVQIFLEEAAEILGNTEATLHQWK